MATSFFKKCSQNTKARQTDYNEIYRLLDKPMSRVAVAKMLKCSLGTIDHARRIRKKNEAAKTNN